MSSNKYWIDRINKQSVLTDKEVESVLKRQYRASAERLAKEYLALYYQVQAEIKSGEPFSPSHIYRLNRYWEAQKQIQKELTRLGEWENSILDDKLGHEYQDIYNSIPLGNFTKISLDQATAAAKVVWVQDGLPYSSRIWQNMELLRQRLDEELIHALSTGSSTAPLVRELTQMQLQQTADSLETNMKLDFDKAYRNAKRLVRTESAHIQTQAAVDRYIQSGVEYVEFITAEGCCEECEAMMGKRIPVSEAASLVPMHPNCKCTIVPIID